MFLIQYLYRIMCVKIRVSPKRVNSDLVTDPYGHLKHGVRQPASSRTRVSPGDAHIVCSLSLHLVRKLSPSRLTPLSRLGSLGKLLVIGIIDPRDEKTPAFKRVSQMEGLASQYGLANDSPISVTNTLRVKPARPSLYASFVRLQHYIGGDFQLVIRQCSVVEPRPCFLP